MSHTKNLDSCGCCEGTEPRTPEPLEQRPGLNALRYRVGTHATFLESMLARLTGLALDIPLEGSEAARARLYPLDALRVRPQGALSQPDDFSIALLDAWAVLADVLTFYQERFANEGYLRTATERRSILELARLVGYQLRPGLSSSVYPAFTLEKGYQVEIPRGTRLQTVPEPGESMQTFEVAEPLQARTEWNAIRPRQVRPSLLIQGQVKELYLQGTATRLQPNDPLLIVYYPGKYGQELHFIKDVEVQAEQDRTRVVLQDQASKAGKMLADKMIALVEKYRSVEEYGVSASSEMGARVLGVLEEIQKSLAASQSVQSIKRTLQVQLPRLRQSRQVAIDNNYTKLAPWISKMVEEIEAMMSEGTDGGGTADAPIDASAIHTPSSPTAMMKRFSTMSKDDRKTLNGLFALVKPLSLPASLQPASSLRLSRQVADLYATQGDMVPRLLASLKPAIKGQLYQAWKGVALPSLGAEVYALRQKASLFGSSAPREPQYNENGSLKLQPWTEWSPFNDEAGDTIFLDNAYEKVQPGGWIALQTPDSSVPLIFGDIAVRTISRSAYGIAGKTTEITLSGETWWTPDSDFTPIRQTRAFVQSEKLELADEPLFDDVSGNDLELDGLYDGLDAGRWVIVSGERTDVAGPDGAIIEGVTASELVMVASVTVNPHQVTIPGSDYEQSFDLPGDTPHTSLHLANDLAYTYKRSSTVVYANVVKATHGETRIEVLGSGSAAQPKQSFTLKQPPLTYLPAPTPQGAESAITVRVNQVEWHEASNLLQLEPQERGFILRTNDEGKTSVVFGDGVHGARLPTGIENVRAEYRSGLGKAGNVKAGQISLLATRPLGVKAVINPLPATGGADPETRDQARRNAPLAVKALDRLVSVQDYADFCRTYAGIAKASAVRLADGRRQVVHVTIAGLDDIPIDANSDLYRNLRQSLTRFGDPYLPVELALREKIVLVLSARVMVHPDYAWEALEPQLRAALLERFGFERGELGKEVHLGQVVSAMQSIQGVSYVDVDVLGGVPESITPGQLANLTDVENPYYLGLADFIPVHLARPNPKPGGAPRLLPAGLAMFDPELPDTLILSEISHA